MNRSLLFFLLLIPGCYYGDSGGSVPAPDVPVPDVVRDDWNFSREIPARWTGPLEAAARLAALSSEYADQLERDGDLDEPQVLTSKDLAVVFDRVLEYGFRGEIAYDERVADLLVAAYEEFEPDREAVDLTPADRKKAVRMYRAFAAALGKVKAQ